MELIMLNPCFRTVLINLLIRANCSAPWKVRKPPDIFCLHFIIRKSRSASLLVNGTAGSVALSCCCYSCLSVFPALLFVQLAEGITNVFIIFIISINVWHFLTYLCFVSICMMLTRYIDKAIFLTVLWEK